jgi:hypothetical protein
MKDIIRMNQLAGIITEGQARKMMEILTEGEVDEMATLISKKSSGNEKSLQVGDIIKWQQAVSSGDNYLGKNYVTMKGKVTKILGPSNVEAEDLETGDLYRVSRKELTVISEMTETLNEGNPDLTKFKNYLNKKSFGMEVLDEPGPNIYFEFWTPSGSQAFEDLLNKLSLKFKKNTERDGGKLVTMYYVDKASAKQLFGK